MTLTRRDVLQAAAMTGAVGVLGPWSAAIASLLDAPPVTKAIPKSDEQIPVIGLGTNRYGVGASPVARAPLHATLERFASLGGRVIDTAPRYGDAETVLGDLIRNLGIREQLFIATKGNMRDSAGVDAQLRESLAQLRTEVLDLVAVHNLHGWQAQLPVMREWREAGRIRYLGLTTSQARQHAELADLMQSQDLDFVQLNYSLGDRDAEQQLLPLAAERGIAVMVNLPFGRGKLFRAVGERPVPEWAAEFDAVTWGQFFLKYVVSHPTVTCAIPGTTKVHHAVDNMTAARGRLPDADQRKRMETFFAEL